VVRRGGDGCFEGTGLGIICEILVIDDNEVDRCIINLGNDEDVYTYYLCEAINSCQIHCFTSLVSTAKKRGRGSLSEVSYNNLNGAESLSERRI